MKLSIAKEFSPMAIGRYKTHNPLSGEVFREEHLTPMLRRAVQARDFLEVDLEGMKGLSASFLEEAFGGLVRSGEWTAKEVLEVVRFVPKGTYFDPYIKNVKDFIREADAKAQESVNAR